MKIPKYIEKALEQRIKAAIALDKADGVILDFIEKHNIDADSAVYGGGVEMYVNPYEAAEIVREAIENHQA